MQSPIGAVNVPILIQNLPDLACTEINSFLDALKALTVYGSVDIPTDITNVVIGAAEPNVNDPYKIWFRYDNSGNFIGIYAFQAGNWRPIIQNVTGEVFWLAVTSTTPPDGFTLIDNAGPSFIPSGVRTYLQTLYYPTPGTPPYTYAAYAFTGY